MPFFSLSILVFFMILWKWQTLTLWSHQKFSPGHWDVESLVWKCDLKPSGLPWSRLPHWHSKGNSSWWMSKLAGCLCQLSPCLEELTPHPSLGLAPGPPPWLSLPDLRSLEVLDQMVLFALPPFFNLTRPYPSNRTASSFGLLAPKTVGSKGSLVVVGIFHVQFSSNHILSQFTWTL